MTDLLPSTQKSPSNPDTPHFTRTPNQTSITGFSHIPKVNIGNVTGELTPVKFGNLILTELGNDIKVIIQNEIKEHLKNKTPKLDQSVTNSYLKEIMLKEELNKKKVIIKDLVETIKSLTRNTLKQQQIQLQSFTSDSDENHHISIVSPVNYKEINSDNTNMNTSNMNDDLRDKITDIVLKKCKDNSILKQLEEVKKKKMTIRFSSSARAVKQVKRFVKLRRFRVSILQIQQ